MPPRQPLKLSFYIPPFLLPSLSLPSPSPLLFSPLPPSFPQISELEIYVAEKDLLHRSITEEMRATRIALQARESKS